MGGGRWKVGENRWAPLGTGAGRSDCCGDEQTRHGVAVGGREDTRVTATAACCRPDRKLVGSLPDSGRGRHGTPVLLQSPVASPGRTTPTMANHRGHRTPWCPSHIQVVSPAPNQPSQPTHVLRKHVTSGEAHERGARLDQEWLLGQQFVVRGPDPASWHGTQRGSARGRGAVSNAMRCHVVSCGRQQTA